MSYHSSKILDSASMTQLCKRMQEAKQASDLRRLQCVYFRGKGLMINEISELTQYSVPHIKRIWTLYFSKGLDAVFCQQRGGRNHYTLELHEEQKLLEKHSEKAGEGRMLKMASLYQDLCDISGKKVALSTVYRMAHRHGWRKLAPRPFHPKRDQDKAAYFKVFFKMSSRGSEI